MGNGIPHHLPAKEEKWEEAQKVIDRLENAMLEQRKKELNPKMLEGAIDVADTKGFNRTNAPLVGRAEFLNELCNHKFADVRVEDYKKKWEVRLGGGWRLEDGAKRQQHIAQSFN